MKNLCLLCTGILYACILPAQPSFQTSLQAGVSLPFNSNAINGTHTARAIHFGNRLDYTFGSETVSIGLGAYIGFINAIGTDNKYKEVGEAIAEKYRLPVSQLTFNASAFKSTHILVGPVASFGSVKCKLNIWAKGGYGLNEPSRYAVMYKEGNIINNIYVNQAGDNKNGLAYSAGAGIKLAISPYVGLQLAAGYFSTQTDQVNYNFEREKGTTPKYFTDANQFIQASAGLQFTIGNPARKNMTPAQKDTGNPVAARMDQKIKTKSNIKNDRVIATGEGDPAAARMDQKIKTKSNIKNDRMAGNTGTGENPYSDSLFFSPEKIELRSVVGGSNPDQSTMQSVDHYLTGFVYQTERGAVISQCGSNAMPGDPIPGLDVKLKRLGTAGNDILAARTNKDGSFAVNNIAPGDYVAETGTTTAVITVGESSSNGLKTLDIMGGSCGNTKENYIIVTPDKTYVEVTSTRDAGSGMASGKRMGKVKYEDIKALAQRDAASGLATGKRMHKPYRVADTEFDINPDNIVSNDGKYYAEVIGSREAGSGMASGRRSTIVTGDVDGDGVDEHAVVAPRDAASGLATGRRMHKPMVITKELDRVNDEDMVTLREAGSGMATGKRMHQPFVVKLDDANDNMDEMVAPRDAASGQATGRRQYQPLIVRIYPDEDSYEIVSPRDAASGLATGKRMHKPMVITKEMNFTEAGEEVVTYRIVHRDIAARNAGDEKMAITENGVPRSKETKKVKPAESYQPWDNTDADEGVVSNPLYEASGAQGVNPLFEAKSDLRVSGSNGKEHTIFVPDNMVIQTGTGIAPNTEYTVGPVKWMAPESIPAGKSINEKGIKRTAGAGADGNAARKGWDGTVKGSGKNINTSEDNLEDMAARKGWDGTVKGGSVVQRIDRVRCANGSCAVEALVETGGLVYEAVITGVLKTKHDTVKNSINNVR